MEPQLNLNMLAAVSDLLIFLLFFIGLFIFWGKMKPRRPLPPGPLGIPVFGYIPWIDAKAPYETLSSLVDKYGRLYSLRLGSVLVIVIADPGLVRKVLSMEETTGRAPLYLTHGIMKGYGLICAEGDLWKEHRRFVLGFMRNNGMKAAAGRDQLQEWIAEVAEGLVQDLKNCPPEGVEVTHLLLHCLGNTMNELIFGLHYEERDPIWRWLRHILEEGIKLIGVVGAINFLPWLRFFPSVRKNVSFIKENQVKTHEEYKKILQDKEEKYLKTLNMKDPNEDTNERSDLMLKYVKERIRRSSFNEAQESFSNEQIFHVAADMFGAGTETTMTTLRWHLLDLALNTDIQREIREELLSFVGDSGYIKMDNLESNPLCMAAVMETQRLRSIIPTGIPHGVLQDFDIDEYHIPKGAMIMPLLWRIHRDEEYWKDPLIFNPKRFINADGTLQKLTAFMPFQTGRRVCLGEDFAKVVLLTFVTKLLLNFEITLPSSSTKESIEKDPVCGLTLIPNPFNLIFTSIACKRNVSESVP